VTDPVCKDCRAEGITTLRKTPHPGPRCVTHHRAFKARQRAASHHRRKDEDFGLGPGGYERLYAAQGGACGGCGVIPGPSARRLAVDHDHSCCPGKTSCGRCVRGLLCYRCNDTLARYRDDGDKLVALARYLREWPSLRAGL
jgi:hypothetical protein